jgi:hypothetical protein
MKLFTKKLFIIPTIIGASTGAPYYGYKFFIDSKHKSYFENVMETIIGISVGFYAGGAIGILWPITSVVYIGRIICKEKEKGKDK